MTYQITKEFRIHHEEDGWFYQFTDDGDGEDYDLGFNDCLKKIKDRLG
jgi:hypothetical protein